ncbi:hypothetical protein [Micromonospora endolithica]|uniref:hypothetical protein n=1 Tax=Micromonospora endolithica TaxID=230091 RepID=UPI0011BD91F9|nr:hypothetical protein [Micromonospora endolithica]
MTEPLGYDWVWGLVDDDPGVRAAAVTRHRALLRSHSWDERNGTLTDLVNDFLIASRAAEPAATRLLPYALLFLDWENRHPDEWRRAGWLWSPWSTKEALLDHLARYHATAAGPALTERLVTAVRRRQHCQDRWYWHLARALDGPRLRDRLRHVARDAAGAGDDRTELRARFVLWLLDSPSEATGSRSWRRWWRDVARPVTAPRPARELAAMPATEVAALLGGLPPAELARVLEGLHAGPAMRIVTVLGLSATEAVALMDARMAAKLLKIMDRPLAVALLTAMPAEAAASRIPGEGYWVLREMDREVALRCLAAMKPTVAGRYLRALWPGEAAAFVRRLEPSRAGAALEYAWPAVPEILGRLPARQAADLRGRLAPHVVDLIRDVVRPDW